MDASDRVIDDMTGDIAYWIWDKTEPLPEGSEEIVTTSYVVEPNVRDVLAQRLLDLAYRMGL